jgi:hypothetical protein
VKVVLLYSIEVRIVNPKDTIIGVLTS